MRESGSLALTGLAVLALVIACNSSEGGTPTPGTGTTTVTESISTKPSSSRPREIKLDGKDPCQLLTQQQLLELKFDRPGRAGTDPTVKAPYCSWTVSGQSIQIIPVTDEGIETWTDGKRTGQPRQIAPLEGFPAITVTLPSDTRRCDLFVDTADGQYLSITFSVDGYKPEQFPKPCDGAQQVAGTVMKNLVK